MSLSDHLPVLVVIVPLLAGPLCVLVERPLAAWGVALAAFAADAGPGVAAAPPAQPPPPPTPLADDLAAPEPEPAVAVPVLEEAPPIDRPWEPGEPAKKKIPVWLLAAAAGGKRFLFRSAASLLTSLAGLPPQPVPARGIALPRSGDGGRAGI